MDYERLIKLLIALKKGKMSYFDEFYELTKKQVFYAALSIVQDTYDAEDILQKAYIKFLETIDRVSEDRTILAYLMRIAKNYAINHVKKRNRVDLIDDERAYDQVAESPPESNSEVMKIMKQELNESEYEIVINHLVLGMTHKEIAQELNKPLGTITWAYNNALNKLRRVIKDD